MPSKTKKTSKGSSKTMKKISGKSVPDAKCKHFTAMCMKCLQVAKKTNKSTKKVLRHLKNCKLTKMKNGVHMLCGNCEVCGGKACKFLGKTDQIVIDAFSSSK